MVLGRRCLVVALSAFTVGVWARTGYADGSILDHIRARDASIQSYRLSASALRFDVPLDKKASLDAAIDVAAGGTDMACVHEHLLSAAERFSPGSRSTASIVHAAATGGTILAEETFANSIYRQQYDGETYKMNLPGSVQKQIEIWPTIAYDMQYTLERMYIVLSDLTSRDVLSTRDEPGGHEIVFSTNPALGSTAEVHLSRDMETERIVFSGANGHYVEKRFIGYSDAGGYPVPQAVVSTRAQPGGYAVTYLLIRVLDINSPVTADEVAFRIPPDALVVDHRSEPPKVFRLMKQPGAKAAVAAIDIAEVLADVGQGVYDDVPQPAYASAYAGPAQHVERTAKARCGFYSMQVLGTMSVGCIFLAGIAVYGMRRRAKRPSERDAVNHRSLKT